MAPHPTSTSLSKHLSAPGRLWLLAPVTALVMGACGDASQSNSRNTLVPGDAPRDTPGQAEGQGDAGVGGDARADLPAPPCPRLSNAGYVRTLSPITNDPVWWPAETFEGCLPLTLDDKPTPDLPPDTVRDEVFAAASVWSSAAEECAVPVCFTDAGSASQAQGIGFDPDADNFNLIAFIADEPTWDRDYPAEVIAVTLSTIEPSTGKLQDADVVLNDGRFLLTSSPSQLPESADLRAVIIHELGHLLGFDHNNAPESVMDPNASATATPPRELSEDDVAGLCELYACYP